MQTGGVWGGISVPSPPFSAPEHHVLIADNCYFFLPRNLVAGRLLYRRAEAGDSPLRLAEAKGSRGSLDRAEFGSNVAEIELRQAG